HRGQVPVAGYLLEIMKIDCGTGIDASPQSENGRAVQGSYGVLTGAAATPTGNSACPPTDLRSTEEHWILRVALSLPPDGYVVAVKGDHVLAGVPRKNP